MIELLGDTRLTVRGDRIGGFPPPGARGGEPGRPGSFAVERADGRVEALAARQSDVHLARGRPFRAAHLGRRWPRGGRTSGERWHVRDDVATGKVTVARATRDYGASA